MQHDVIVFDIAANKTSRRKFDTKETADSYAKELREFYLNRENPAPLFIDVVPV